MIENLEDIVFYIFNIAIIGGIALTIFMIVFQGINILNSRGDPSAFSKAKEKIKNTLIGLGVLLLSYVLLTTINPGIFNLDLNVGEINITPLIPISSPAPVKELDVYTFEEIPIGTITEELLAGISSPETPCYQYETTLRDASGNIIVGNVIDQNKDGKIDEKDILLNKDLFYCMKLLTDAYTAKVEYHLKTLIDELNSLMKSGCACSNLYVGRFEGQGIITSQCGKDLGYEKVIMPYNSGKYRPATCPHHKCSACPTPYSFCRQVCGGEYGCPDAQPSYYGPVTNPYTEEFGFKQYEYDTCSNRLAIKCKTEEIQRLITGQKPSQVCYDAGYFSEENEIDESMFLTLNVGIQRIEYFKDYFQKRLAQLSCVKEKMKIPWGERITLAEYEKLKSEATKYKIEKAIFEEYDISRYCGEFNSEEDALNSDHPCKEVESESGEYEKQYFYDGDSATFYFNEDYNNYKNHITRNQPQQKCTIIEGDMDLGNYAGVIPIGEVVDEAQEWGKIIVHTIDNILLESRAIIDNVIEISNIPSTCSSSRCTTWNAHYGYTTYSSSRCGNSKKCSCDRLLWWACGEGIPNTMVPERFQVMEVPDYSLWCRKCDSQRNSYYYCSSNQPSLDGACWCGMKAYGVPRPQYWVCDYEKFCNLVKKIYWSNDKIEKDNFIYTTDDSEKSKRNSNLSKIGHLQRFKGFADVLKNLSVVKIDTPQYNISSPNIVGNICECELAGSTTTPIFESNISYNYSCSYTYQSISTQHTNCPYSYDGPVGMYWCQKENKYWSCPIISSQCNNPPPYVPPIETEDPVASDPIGDYDDDEGEIIECPYDDADLEDEDGLYWCEKQGVYWSCPIRDEDQEDCLIDADEEIDCPIDPDYESSENIYYCERQEKYWSCPTTREYCDILFCPVGEVATGSYYCPAEDNYWCIDPPEECFTISGYEIVDCPYVLTPEIEEIYGSGTGWCEKQGVYWSCPIRDEDHDLCFDDLSSFNDSLFFGNTDDKLSSTSESNFFLKILNNIKNFIVGLFVDKTKTIVQSGTSYLSELLSPDKCWAKKKKKKTVSCNVSPPASCCSPASINQSFTSTDSAKNIEIKGRFDMLEKLSYSRKKLTGCVKGYGAGYKDNPTEVVEVISCMEGVSGPGVLILPDFPYPNKSKANPPYNNCYPQNSEKLTKEEKLQCFYNPLREGTESNPGCLLITKEYMDNYYCCN